MAVGAAQVSAAGAAVVLNEVNCEGTDWVELVNTSDTEADISGWLLTDDPLTSTRADHRLVFSTPTVIPPRSDLVIEKGLTGFPFGISCGNDTIRLADSAGTLADEIAVPTLTSGGDTWGRYPNGTGAWLQTKSTKAAPNEPSSAAGDPIADLTAWMFDPSTVVVIDLTLPQASRDALSLEPTEYQDAVFSLTTTGGTYGPLQIGARLKGKFGSFRPLTGKAAFKLKFNHSVAGQRFLGLKKLTLNNMVQDPSMIHEVLAYEAFRSVGVAAPRTGYAYLRVNGQDYGLYLNVETLDEVSLPRWFDSTQHLYEGAYGSDVSPGNAGAFEVDVGSDTDRGDLEALIAAVGDDGHPWSDRMAAVADLRQMTRMWAVEKYIGHWDGYAGRIDALHPNNFYLHSDAAGKFGMLPWGTDQTWGERTPFDGPAGLLFNKCLGDASCLALYRDAVEEVRSSIAGLDLDSLAINTATLLAPWHQMDPRRESSVDDFWAGVSAARAFLGVRPDDVAAWLSQPPPAEPQPPDPPPSAGLSPSANPAVAYSQFPGLAAPPVQQSPVHPPPPTVTQTRSLTVGPPSVAAGVITTRLSLPGPGRVNQRATTSARGRVLTVCTARATRTRAGAVTMRCRLSSAARGLLRSRSLNLLVRTGFAPAQGSPRAVTRRVTARCQKANLRC
jgi:hypothetical protein